MQEVASPRAGLAAAHGEWSRTTAADGTVLAWRADGAVDARLPVVLCNGIACTDTYWPGVVDALAETRGVVRWDYAGHGRSGPPAARRPASVDAVVGDLRAVLDAAAVGRFVVAGHSFGVQVALEATRALPARVAGVVAIAGSPGRPLNETVARVCFPLLARVTARAPYASGRLWRGLWGTEAVDRIARVLRGTNGRVPDEIMRAYYDHVGGRQPEVLLELFTAMASHDAADVLDDMGVPMLALAGDADGLTPLEVMTRMAVRGRGELVVVPGGSHTLPAEYPERVADEIARFCDSVEDEHAA